MRVTTSIAYRNNSKKQGLSSCLSVVCTHCKHEEEFFTPQQFGSGRAMSYNVNLRMTYTMRTLAHGHSGIANSMVQIQC